MEFAGNNDETIEIPVINNSTVRPAYTSGRAPVLPAHLRFHLLPVGEEDGSQQVYYGPDVPLFGWLRVPTFAVSLLIFICGLVFAFQLGLSTQSTPRYDADGGSRPSQSQEATASPNVTTSSKPTSPKPTEADGGNDQPVDRPTQETGSDDKPGIQPVTIEEGKPTQSPPPESPSPTTVSPTAHPDNPSPTSEPPVATTTPEPTTTSPTIVVVTDEPTATSAPPETPEATAPPSGTTVP